MSRSRSHSSTSPSSSLSPSSSSTNQLASTSLRIDPGVTSFHKSGCSLISSPILPFFLLLLLMVPPSVLPSPVSTSSLDQEATLSPSAELDKRANASDPRRIMCGYQLIVNLKQQCGERGTFSPYERGPRIRRGLRLGRPPSITAKSRGRKPDDFCAIYLRYEPYTIVTECCCRGCTRRFLEQFCAKG